jgi:hypothetical protein
MGKIMVGLSIPTGISSGMLLTRAGLFNPWKRVSEWQRIHRLRWKDKALQADAQYDWAAQTWTGEADPAAARRIMEERLARLQKGKRRGRPPRTPTQLSHEKWVEITQDIRRLHDSGLSWANAGARHGYSGDTAKKWVVWLEEYTRAS